MHAKQLAKIMKALSNENRLKLYLEIAKHGESDFEAQECNISDIAALTQSMQSIQWDASSYSSGVYFYKLEAEGYTETKKMILLK